VITPVLGGDDLRSQAVSVAGLLGELRVTRFAAVGHAHGGAVAQLLTLEDVGVGALVLIDSAAFDLAPPTDLDPRTFVERGSVEFADLSAADLDAYTTVEGGPPLGIDLTPEAERMASWDLPVFLLWGEDDPYLPVDVAERLSDAIGGSTLGLVPDSGHLLLDDAFDPVGVMILEYLRARYQGAPHGHEGLVMLQLERRPSWVDLAPEMADDGEPTVGTDQEVGPHA
jgi:pimeloyl-ACP methyl ester carboxylesterase